jgi:mannonate dehydratase
MTHSSLTNKGRRRFLWAAGALAAGAAVGTVWHRRAPFLVNPCAPPTLDLPWLPALWQGLHPEYVWDMHVHLAGLADGTGQVGVGPKLDSPAHPLLHLQKLFYMNGGCAVIESGNTAAANRTYVWRLAEGVGRMPDGAKLLLVAFDWLCDEAGRPRPEDSAFYVSDEYAATVAGQRPTRFEWAASVHPYRPDAVERLERAKAKGARAVKWLPSAQNIDPASPACDAFYAALARLDLPLLCHGGEEKAVPNPSLDYLNNPLRLRRPLQAGVRVVIAHCASIGEHDDLDFPGKRAKSFDLFSRLMAEKDWDGLLFGDISAVFLRNRPLSVIHTLFEREDWHARLLNGSDYPLPGILPLISLSALARGGLLPAEFLPGLTALREANPVYFDFALKRLAHWQGKRLPANIFETRRFFEASKNR